MTGVIHPLEGAAVSEGSNAVPIDAPVPPLYILAQISRLKLSVPQAARHHGGPLHT